MPSELDDLSMEAWKAKYQAQADKVFEHIAREQELAEIEAEVKRLQQRRAEIERTS